MRLIEKLTEKPWITEQGTVVAFNDGREFALPVATVGLRLFLAVVTVLFFLLITSYGWRMALEVSRPLPDSWLLWLNTSLLVGSSIALQWASMNARRGRMEELKLGLILGGLCTFAFLAGQLLAWRQLAAVNTLSPTNPANTFFYLITAVHGLHLVGGLVVWVRTTVKAWRGYGATKLRLTVELCAFYWHFMLAVWLVLFFVLFHPGASLPLLCRALAS